MKKRLILALLAISFIFINGCTTVEVPSPEEKFPGQETQIVPEEKIVESAEPMKEYFKKI